METKSHLLIAMQAALTAGDSILQIYNQDFSIEQKSDDSPLTLADKVSNEIISSYLEPSGIPILSEEGKSIDYSIRKNWKIFWLVDPLDGTKEFIKKNGEFTVNIALIKDVSPVLGVVYIPALSLLYFSAAGLGAYRLSNNVEYRHDLTLHDILEKSVRIRIDASGIRPFTIVGSRSHATPDLEVYVNARRREFQEVEFVSAGSSLKFCQVAEGRADEYPRLGTTMEWDTAAGQIIAEQSGAKVTVWNTGSPLIYNKEELKNPWFVVSNGRS